MHGNCNRGKQVNLEMREENEIQEIKDILAQHEKRINLLESMVQSSKPEVKPLSIEDKMDFTKLAQKIDVSVEKIKELFDIEEDTLTLLKALGEDDREKTKEISLAVLLGYKCFLGNERVLAKELRRNVAESRVPLDNFATYLNQLIPSLIRRIGKPKSTKTTYKLTLLGEVEAREIIKKLCE
jgi:hypothetical protein